MLQVYSRLFFVFFHRIDTQKLLFAYDKGKEKRRAVMKIRFVGRDRLRKFRENYEWEEEELLLFGLEGIGEVSYEKELKNESNEFEQIALLSKSSKGVVVCGCVTDTRGLKRKSAVVAENGKILGVSDTLHVIDGGASAGAALRVYETKLGKMGVVVAEDLYFPEVIQALSLCGSDFIVCLFGMAVDGLTQAMVRSYAYLYGVPIFFCGVGYSMIADMGGSVAFSSAKSPVVTNFVNVKEYHLVETRRRGLYSERIGK